MEGFCYFWNFNLYLSHPWYRGNPQHVLNCKLCCCDTAPTQPVHRPPPTRAPPLLAFFHSRYFCINYILLNLVKSATLQRFSTVRVHPTVSNWKLLFRHVVFVLSNWHGVSHSSKVHFRKHNRSIIITRKSTRPF